MMLATALSFWAARSVLAAPALVVGAGMIWQPIITLGEAGLTTCGAIGILIGGYIKAMAGPDMTRQAVGTKIIRNAVGGFCVGALSSAISALFFGFT